MKKLASSLCVIALLATSLAPLQTSANELKVVNEQGIELPVVKVDSEALSVVRKNLKTVREHVFFGEDGFYHLKPELKDILTPEEYDYFVKSNETINNLIKDGIINVDEDGQSIDNNIKAMSFSGDDYEHMEEYWWGTHYIFNRTQADNLQEALEDAKDTYDYYSIALTLVPEVLYSKILALMSQLLGKRADVLAKAIEDEKTSKGVYADFGWDGLTYNIYGR